MPLLAGRIQRNPATFSPRLPSQVWKGAPRQIKATEATLSKKYNSEVTASGCDLENSQNVSMVKRVLKIYAESATLSTRDVCPTPYTVLERYCIILLGIRKRKMPRGGYRKLVEQ